MTLDSGTATIKRATVATPTGSMPSITWTKVFEGYYGSRTVGYNRYFTAMAADSRIDLLIRIQRYVATTADIVVLVPASTDGTAGTYRIVQIQHLDDEDGLPVTDLSLQRTEGVNDPV